MSEALEKLGIYDLMAVLLSGVCITTFSLLADQILFQSQLSNFIKVEETISFLVISYFIGLVFQEIGSFIYKKLIQLDKTILEKVLDKSNDTSLTLTQEEKDGIKKAVLKRINVQTDRDIDMVYNYCKFHLISSGSVARADKDQSTSGLSRSLSLFFFILAIITTWSAISAQYVAYFVYAVGELVLSCLLYYRCRRFVQMRYIYILRSFYYSLLRDTPGNGANDSTTKKNTKGAASAQ